MKILARGIRAISSSVALAVMIIEPKRVEFTPSVF